MKCLKYAVLIAVPTITCAEFFKKWYRYRLNKLYKQHLPFLKWYTRGNISDRPCESTTNQNEKKMNVKELYEPILYFIETAETSIDISVTSITVQCVIDELMEAVKRNVKVRIITDFHSNRNYKLLIPLQRVGVEVLYYIPPPDNLNNIFHCKYIVKDHSTTPEEGYLCVGSLNFSVSAVTTGYENINFIRDHELVTQFRNHFEESWSRITDINNNNSHIKELLKEMDLYL
ncbi:hypothetical protein RI129_011815 [Pyrocoelia pectoralis]|uniref:Mitochondrial cardiolipin hydrolase n=1 Tax=Pyrocoelia pectoralis TaxID=417401 RepID=A0AAN7ZHG8_9COLE